MNSGGTGWERMTTGGIATGAADQLQGPHASMRQNENKRDASFKDGDRHRRQERQAFQHQEAPANT